MKWEEIEQGIRDYTALKEDAKADAALENHLKTSVWNNIENNINPAPKLWIMGLVAASLLGIILAVTINAYVQKNTELTYLKTEIERKSKENSSILAKLTQLQHEQMLSQNTPPKIDTVYKTKIIYKTIYQANSIVPVKEPIAHGIDSISIQPVNVTQKLTELCNDELKLKTGDSLKLKELSQWEEYFSIIIQYRQDNASNEVKEEMYYISDWLME